MPLYHTTFPLLFKILSVLLNFSLRSGRHKTIVHRTMRALPEAFISQDAISCERTKVCFAHLAGYCFGSTAFVPRASRLLFCELRIMPEAFISQDAISCEIKSGRISPAADIILIVQALLLYLCTLLHCRSNGKVCLIIGNQRCLECMIQVTFARPYRI